MQLPVRYQSSAAGARVISVDGAFDAPGLNLSHWPGHQTPAELRRDLSTECALAFVQLPPERQAELARGCTAIVNNHYDTDGNCALFAVRHPELALPRAAALVEAAAAGDFFQGANEQAFSVDCIVHGIFDPQRSPIAERLAGLEGDARASAASEYVFEHLCAILDGDTKPFEALFTQELAQLRADKLDLSLAAKDDIAHLDWCVWTAPMGLRSSRAPAVDSFDPGRHALFSGKARDRALAIGPRGDGTTYRRSVSTFSWFDLVTRASLPRAPLEPLAAELNRLEGVSADSPLAWRCHPSATPSPELWFGREQPDLFVEHCGALAPSRLEPAIVRRTIAAALRDALELPQ